MKTNRYQFFFALLVIVFPSLLLAAEPDFTLGRAVSNINGLVQIDLTPGGRVVITDSLSPVNTIRLEDYSGAEIYSVSGYGLLRTTFSDQLLLSGLNIDRNLVSQPIYLTSPTGQVTKVGDIPFSSSVELAPDGGVVTLSSDRLTLQLYRKDLPVITLSDPIAKLFVSTGPNEDSSSRFIKLNFAINNGLVSFSRNVFPNLFVDAQNIFISSLTNSSDIPRGVGDGWTDLLQIDSSTYAARSSRGFLGNTRVCKYQDAGASCSALSIPSDRNGLYLERISSENDLFFKGNTLESQKQDSPTERKLGFALNGDTKSKPLFCALPPLRSLKPLYISKYTPDANGSVLATFSGSTEVAFNDSYLFLRATRKPNSEYSSCATLSVGVESKCRSLFRRSINGGLVLSKKSNRKSRLCTFTAQLTDSTGKALSGVRLVGSGSSSALVTDSKGYARFSTNVGGSKTRADIELTARNPLGKFWTVGTRIKFLSN